MVGAASTEPKPKTDAVEIPSDKTGCTGSNLFLLSRFFRQNSAVHAILRPHRRRQKKQGTASPGTGVAGRGGRDGAVAPGKAEAKARRPTVSAATERAATRAAHAMPSFIIPSRGGVRGGGAAASQNFQSPDTS